jgi:peptidoglycan/xylan/chitin deacetylase (PgdA/CDA1 family)
MAFGSVEFFKKLIRIGLFVVLPICIILVLLLSVLLIVTHIQHRAEIDRLKTEIAGLREEVRLARQVSFVRFNTMTNRRIHLVEAGSDIQIDPDQIIEPNGSDPADPTNPTGPTEPTGPARPTEPTEPVQPVETSAADPVSPTPQLTESTDPNDPFPSFYALKVPIVVPEDRVAYLTFDDGPSERTLEILEILRRENVQATFFVVNKTGERAAEIMRQTAADGHAIGMHSATHVYDTIYASTDAFLTDFWDNFMFIRDTTGQSPTVFRCPGGSLNSHNNKTGIPILVEMTRRGFVCFDWNCATGDAGSTPLKAKEMVQSVLDTARNRDQIVVLAHDAKNKYTTVEALPAIIRALRERGYRFAALDGSVKPVLYTSTQNALDRLKTP